MNYVDEIAVEIFYAAKEKGEPEEDILLYRCYALLMLAKGVAVTNEDIHNAWCVWAAEHAPDHPCLIPYNQLKTAVQDLDTKYKRAVQDVANRYGAGG